MMRLRTLRGKIIAFSSFTLIILTVATFYSSLVTVELSGSVEYLFKNNQFMEKLGQSVAQTDATLTDYLRTKSSDSLKSYIMNSTKLGELSRSLNRKILGDEIWLLQKSLAGMIDHYLFQTESCVKAKRGRDVQGYTSYYDQSRQDSLNMGTLIQKIQKIYLSGSLEAFAGYKSRLPLIIISNAVLLLAAFSMGFLLLVRYSYAITDPLLHLAQAARAMARGDYDTRFALPRSTDEVKTTAEAFRIMQESIRKTFEELKEKSALEKRLLGEEMKGLQMSHQLKEAELLALQTQINPHFLYNTLSAGYQLALTENADHTADFLENLGVFIRYVLKTPARMVTIRDEIECLTRYIRLMELRFGDRYAFSLETDDKLLGERVPALVLQPLVENSVSHGLQDREHGGTVKIAVCQEGEGVCLSVTDNGVGMSREEIETLKYETQTLSPSNSIGLRNVIRRIGIVTEGLGQVVLEGEKGVGLKVKVWIPLGSLT